MASGYNSWEKQFDGHVNLIVKTSSKVLYEASELLRDTIELRTPVGKPELWKYPAAPGYTPGTLKASWTITHSKNMAVIQNSVPYAYRVETGWSTQAPYGMMRVSLKSWPSILNNVAAKHKK